MHLSKYLLTAVEKNKMHINPREIPEKFGGAIIESIETLCGDLCFVHIKTNKGLLTLSYEPLLTEDEKERHHNN